MAQQRGMDFGSVTRIFVNIALRKVRDVADNFRSSPEGSWKVGAGVPQGPGAGHPCSALHAPSCRGGAMT